MWKRKTESAIEMLAMTYNSLVLMTIITATREGMRAVSAIETKFDIDL